MRTYTIYDLESKSGVDVVNDPYRRLALIDYPVLPVRGDRMYRARFYRRYGTGQLALGPINVNDDEDDEDEYDEDRYERLYEDDDHALVVWSVPSPAQVDEELTDADVIAVNDDGERTTVLAIVCLEQQLVLQANGLLYYLDAYINPQPIHPLMRIFLEK